MDSLWLDIYLIAVTNDDFPDLHAQLSDHYSCL